MIEPTVTDGHSRRPYCESPSVILTTRTVPILGCFVDNLRNVGVNREISQEEDPSYLIEGRKDVVSELDK